MNELHENEQYFFSENSLNELTLMLSDFDNICCLCTPLLGKKLNELGKIISILDIDKRFSDMECFTYYDINRPKYLENNFDVIVCDPPFFNVSLDRLFKTIQMLSHYNYNQKLLIMYLERRQLNIMNTFCGFNILPYNYIPEYQTVKVCEKNRVIAFSNFLI